VLGDALAEIDVKRRENSGDARVAGVIEAIERARGTVLGSITVAQLYAGAEQAPRAHD
jgi:hypothetical protein